MQEQLPNARAPDQSVISHILKNDIGLRYKRFDGALIRYKDPEFDEKRLWVCRILSQFIADGALVISIDESNFRHDNTKQHKWQFVDQDREFKYAVQNSGQAEATANENESSIRMWGQISS